LYSCLLGTLEKQAEKAYIYQRYGARGLGNMSGDARVILILGGVFVFLGILALLWGNREESSWWGSISEHFDVREYMDHTPGRFEPDALRIGGKISIAVGIVLCLIAAGFIIWK
jgi:hypothetical protein